MRKLFVVLIIIVLLSICFCGCSERTGNIVNSIVIKSNSFKASYEVDEQLNFDNIFVLATYSNGETTYVQCDFSMVKNFDTTTCGDKQLHVEYKGVSSEILNYEVVYSIDNTKSINTTARLEYTPTIKNEVLCYQLNYYCGNLTNVEAILFSITADQSLDIDIDLSNLSYELPSGWCAYVVNSSNQTLRVLIYNKDNATGLSSNTTFYINVNKGNEKAVTKLADIELSTGGLTATKYYLPDYTR